MDQSVERAMTIPEAASLLPFAESTLRKYIRAWEVAYVSLPVDPEGRKHLVKPLVEIFRDAHQLNDQGIKPLAKRLEAAVGARTGRLIEIGTTFLRCPGDQLLAGVEDVATRLTLEMLRHLNAHIALLDETQRSASRVQRRAEALRNDILPNIACWVDAQRDDAHRLSESAKHHAADLAEVTRSIARAARR